MLSIIDVVVTLGQRNVAFRGHNWNKTEKREDANFNFFLYWKAKLDPVLQDHLKNAPKNALYKSPLIQNELITLAGLEIRQRILDDAKAARWYSVMADECTDTSSHEQMAICIRFVDVSTCTSPEIREEFLGFV